MTVFLALSHEDYTIGWVCALPLELAAAQSMLDAEHGAPPHDPCDHNTYTFGRIGKHNVVMACLPAGSIGIGPAARVAMQMQNTFRRLEFSLLVGIGGGVPSKDNDIRLGDIVVSLPADNHGGVVQYDLGKTTQEGQFLRTGTLNKPPSVLLTALSTLQAKHLRSGPDFETHLSSALERNPSMAAKFARPHDDADILYEALYDHPKGISSCYKCDDHMKVSRPPRPANLSIAHYGLIASANQVMRHGATRQRLGLETRAICVEMEAAGLMDDFRCIVIRGICDYADSHKNKKWQPYSAIAAACYAKELLYIIPGRRAANAGATLEAVDRPGSSLVEQNTLQNADSQFTHRPHSFGVDRIPTYESTSSAYNRRSQMDRSSASEDSDAVSKGHLNQDDADPESGSRSSPPAHRENRHLSLVEKGIQKTLNEFRLILTPKQYNAFRTTTLKDLRTTLLRIEKDQAEKSKAMNLPRAEAFLEQVQRLSASSALDTSESCTYIWASVKFVLQATASSPVAFEALLNAYDGMAQSMVLEDEDFAWWCNCPQKDESLAKVHENISQFHMLVLPLLTIPAWRHVFSSAWRGFELRRAHILRDLRRYQALIQTRASAAEFHEHDERRQLARRALEQAYDKERKARSGMILQWLAGADSQLDHDDLCKIRQSFSPSGRWFFKHPVFRCWRHDDIPKKPGLWVIGMPGAGKTILASSAIEHCEQDKMAQTVYFYCKHGDPQRTTLMPILKSILSQLISPNHPLLSWCYDQYLGSNQLSLSSEKTCKEMLRTMLWNTDRSFIIVDGVDECAQHDRRLLLTFLSWIISECDPQHPGKLRVMVVSRDEPDIRRNLGNFSELAIRPDDNEGDIRNFIAQWRPKIQANFEELDEATLDYICTSTLNRADGMFLFAKLVMTNLCQQINLQSLQQEISPDHFPKGLEQAYSRILDRISGDENSAKVAMARQILAWMTCARRPLKWHEIQGAMSIETGDGSVDFTRRRARIHIREICGSLINDLSGDRLELVHSTAKDFLVRSAFVAPHKTETYLAALCMTYLTFECFDEDLDESKRREFLLEGSFAFQDYAITHWSDHVNAAIKAGPIQSSEPRDDTPNLGLAVTNFVAHCKLHDGDFEKSNGSGQACSLFSEADYFDDICAVFEHIQSQRARGIGHLDQIHPKALEHAVTSSRTILQRYARSTDIDTSLQQDLIMKYGSKWFKCPKVTCFYFHEGFGDLKSQEHHIARHEQPFRCGYKDCERGYRLGFTKQRELEKHMSIYHPGSGRMVPTFARLKRTRDESEDTHTQSPKRAKAPPAFACEHCPKSFTRNSTLKSQLLTHTNERPFKCSLCEQRFVRDNDRKRHEKIHSGEKNYYCWGRLKHGSPESIFWGCGRAFPRLEALKNHHRSEAGQSCLKPLYEEEERDRQLKLQIEERKADGLELPPPQGVIELYRELQDSDSEDIVVSSALSDGSDRNRSQGKIWRPFGRSPLAGSATPKVIAARSPLLNDQEATE